MRKVQILVFVAVLVASEIVLTRFASIQTATIRIGFGFIPLALTSMLFGPIVGGIMGATSDVLGMLIFPKFAYFPGFTLSAFVGGFIYGLVLYNKPKSLLRVALAVLLVTLIKDLGLNTLWLHMMYDRAFIVLLFGRIITNAIMFFVQITLIPIVWKRIGLVIQRHYSREILQ